MICNKSPHTMIGEKNHLLCSRIYGQEIRWRTEERVCLCSIMWSWKNPNRSYLRWYHLNAPSVWSCWLGDSVLLHWGISCVSPHGLCWAFLQCGGWDTRTNIPKVTESQDKLQYFLTQLSKSQSITSTISTGWSIYQTLARFKGKEYFSTSLWEECQPYCKKNIEK